jgi:membrane associated rhomboid family serine protease
VTQKRLLDDLRDVVLWVLTPVVLFWLLEVADELFLPAPGLDVYGIRPRTLAGLWGIALAPWLHGSFGHLAANTVPFLVFGTLIAGRGLGEFVLVSLGIALLGGFGVWLIGSPHSVHIGVSGVIFGYFAYLLTIGWVERHFAWIALSIVIAFFYGGLIVGVLPSMPGISWESHLCGFLAGIFVARRFGRRRPSRASRSAARLRDSR